MSQTGTIYGYHDGNTYSLANIYDENLSEMEEEDASGLTVENLWFTDTGYRATFGLESYKLGYPNLHVGNGIATNSISEIPYLTTENTPGGYGIAMGKTNWFHSGFQFNTDEPNFTIELWIYIDANTLTTTRHVLFSLNRTYTTLAGTTTTNNLELACNYKNSMVNFFIGSAMPTSSQITQVKTFDSSILDKPVHVAYILKAGEQQRWYINGELYYYWNGVATHNYKSYKINTAAINGCLDRSNSKAASASGYPMTFSGFRFTYGARYHDNFTPQSFAPKIIPVNANMLIRHADANHYIPLTADAANTSAPYIAVRHGNTNFYTLK